MSGRREKFVPRGGPDGGDGGRGGSVFLTCDPNVNTLLEFRYKRRFEGGSGANGASALKHGKDGEDIIVVVPEGTQVWSTDDSPPKLIADLSTAGQTVLVARGGNGGRGNARFASSTNQYPLLAEEGEHGEDMDLRLELKLLADVGIIGLPNAGKSSLISVVSAARPKIAAYPFTTLEPVLGMVERHNETFVMVDIPGLIEGAHEGIGLGHDFLRHVERTRVLVHMVDGAAMDPYEDYKKINQELALFNEELAVKPQIIAINKIDIPGVIDLEREMREMFSEETSPVLFVSAATRDGVDVLLDRVVQMIDESKRDEFGRLLPPIEGEVPVLTPKPRRQPIHVQRMDGDVYVVDVPRAARIAAMVDDRNWNAIMQFYGYLRRTGIVKALEEAGVMPGDKVFFGDVEWEWD